jgi:hypothetical protein
LALIFASIGADTATSSSESESILASLAHTPTFLGPDLS